VRTAARSDPATEADHTSARTVAIIMDGNGAGRRSRPARRGRASRGHAARCDARRGAIDLGITTLAVYAFSTENWSRPPDEVAALMVILGETIEKELPTSPSMACDRFFGQA
jgi:undecaprenyl diphosphate synthase